MPSCNSISVPRGQFKRRGPLSPCRFSPVWVSEFRRNEWTKHENVFEENASTISFWATCGQSAAEVISSEGRGEKAGNLTRIGDTFSRSPVNTRLHRSSRLLNPGSFLFFSIVHDRYSNHPRGEFRCTTLTATTSTANFSKFERIKCAIIIGKSLRLHKKIPNVVHRSFLSSIELNDNVVSLALHGRWIDATTT